MECAGEVKADIVLVGTTLVLLFQSFHFCVYHVGSSEIPRVFSRILHAALLNFVIGSLLWFTVGYSMVFGKSQKGFIGSMNHALLLDLQESTFHGNETTCVTKPYPDIVLVTFEMAFAIMAPIMVLTTWVDNIKPAGAVLFLTLWPLLVYYPVTHWIRGGGWLSTTIRALDFAGGLTMHTAAGASHILLTAVMKKNLPSCDKVSIVDQYSQNINENVQTTILAAGSLFTAFGWYCFNVGSLRNSDNSYSLVVLNTHLAACGSVIFWLLCSFINGRWSLVDILNGLMVGLAAACSFSGYVETWSALLIGCTIGSLSCGLFTMMKNRASLFTRKKAVDITFLFGVPAILGSIAAGLFSRTTVDSKAENGALFSNGTQLLRQLLGITVVIVWSLLWSSLLLKFIHSTVGLFVPESERSTNLLQEIQERNNTEASLKERLIKAAKSGKLDEIQELHEKFNVDLGLKDFNQRTPLHYVCEGGHTKCAEYLVEQREVNIHAKDKYGATALTEAVRKYRDKLVELLLEHGANWVLDGVGEILCSYVLEGKVEEIRRLQLLGMDLNAQDSHGRTALHIAASKGDKMMVQSLIDANVHMNKVDLFGNRALNCAEMHEQDEISEILVRHGALRISQNYSQREICDEASKGNLRMIRHMINNGASVCHCDGNGRTALHMSAKAGHLDMVEFLLSQSGVNINARDKKNNTPLTDAIINMHNDVAEFIQLHGGEIEEKRMMHLICKATRWCDKRLLKQLLLWFNGSTAVDYDGQSAYHICVKLGDADMVRILAKAGINYKEVNLSGYTPLELAIQLKSRCSITKLLSDFEEGKFMSYSSSGASLRNKKHVPNHKSKIRRRRTRRQTRVEVAVNDCAIEEMTTEKENQTAKRVSENAMSKRVSGNAISTVVSENAMAKGVSENANARPKMPMSHANGLRKDLNGQRMEETKPVAETEQEEVTLADIELMNRRKHYLHEPVRFTKMIGAPQYV